MVFRGRGFQRSSPPHQGVSTFGPRAPIIPVHVQAAGPWGIPTVTLASTKGCGFRNTSAPTEILRLKRRIQLWGKHTNKRNHWARPIPGKVGHEATGSQDQVPSATGSEGDSAGEAAQNQPGHPSALGSLVRAGPRPHLRGASIPSAPWLRSRWSEMPWACPGPWLRGGGWGPGALSRRPRQRRKVPRCPRPQRCKVPRCPSPCVLFPLPGPAEGPVHTVAQRKGLAGVDSGISGSGHRPCALG